jgi:hypothetical protein
VLIGAVFLAGESPGDGGFDEALVDCGVGEGGEVENAGGRLFFARVEKHRVNYNNKMDCCII